MAGFRRLVVEMMTTGTSEAVKKMNQAKPLIVRDQFTYHGHIMFGLSVLCEPYDAVTVGCTIRSQNGQIIDIFNREKTLSGLVLWDIEAPQACRNNPASPMDGWSGQIIFALWQDSTFQERIADTGWISWRAPWLIGSSTTGLSMQEEEIRNKYGSNAERW